MTRQLVLVHGRSQEDKDSLALKAEWLDALDEGLAKSGLRLPIAESDVRFPYYGDTLRDLVGDVSAEEAAAVVVRGPALAAEDPEELAFTEALMREIQAKTGISDEQVAAVIDAEVVARGPQNWEWVQGILRAIDRYVPHGSGASIALFTRDVYRFLRRTGIRTAIEEGVARALSDTHESVVVGHSLGTVVTYNLLRRQGHLQGWKVPLFVTLGSPLAIQAIRGALRQIEPLRCPSCVSTWFNAMDERDVVALYPLDPLNFPLAPALPAIENKTDVRNRTRNRHGIGGYLDDAVVARRIHDALTAPGE